MRSAGLLGGWLAGVCGSTMGLSAEVAGSFDARWRWWDKGRRRVDSQVGVVGGCL